MAKNRPLRAVLHRLGRVDLLIEKIIDERGTAEVLEVGCGLGLPMLELKKKFGPRLRITGINKDARFNQPGQALWEGVKKRCFWPWEPLLYERRFGFPNYVNCDASTGLPFADGSVDLVYSIATTFFLIDKLNFLKEVNRVLRSGCIARIHFTHSASESCHPDQLPASPYDNLCEIRDATGSVVDVEAFLNSHEFVRVVQQEGNRPKYLELTKQCPAIDFGVRFVEGYFLTEVNKAWVPYARSVYAI